MVTIRHLLLGTWSVALLAAACDGSSPAAGSSGGSSATSAGATQGTSGGGMTDVGGAGAAAGRSAGGAGGSAGSGEGTAGAIELATGGNGAGGASDGEADATPGDSNGCAIDCASSSLTCCGSECLNTNNDIKNCGTCGNECSGDFPFCDNGTCGAPQCGAGTSCGLGQQCCNDECCSPGQLCCVVPGGPDGPPRCVAPVQDSCPVGCPTCPCTSPDTPIATPQGERAIAELRPGDLVYSVHDNATAVVPIKAVSENPVFAHHVLRIRLETGVVLQISALHPTADGRTLASVNAGGEIDGVRVLAIEQIPYPYRHTYDILPDSDSGAYYAGGVLIGSTLFAAR